MKTFAIQALVALMCINGVSPVFADMQPVAPKTLSADLTALSPTNILPDDFTTAIKLQDRSKSDKPATLNRVDTAGAPVSVRIEANGRSLNASSIESVILTSQPVKKGDVCLLRFSVRALRARQETGEAAFNCYFQRSSPGYEKSMTVQLGAGPDWRTYEIPFQAKNDFSAGEAALCFGFGLIPQSVEISSLQILNFQNRTTMAKLPATRFSYPGREPGAAWRTKALARIEEIRMAPIDIVVTDDSGKPVEGVEIKAQLAQPAFIFGTAVSVGLITSKDPDAQVYRDKVTELFDTVTIDNDLKWGGWLGMQRRQNTMQAMDWIDSKGLRLRGHNLVWPGFKFLPKRLQKTSNPTVEIPQQIETHIEDIVTTTKGRTWAWDVLNEPLHERDLYNIFPETKSADWFKQAHKLDPHALLFVNEYAMLNGRSSPDFIKQYLTFIKMLKDNAAPLDGIGVQAHIGSQVRGPADVLSDLDLLQTSGLPINITEFDVDTKDEELQGDYTRDFLIAIYSHPGVTGFIQWGFWQKNHWKPDAAMFRSDWSEKPSAKAWRDLVLGQWRSRVDATTNAQGEITSRGHLGVYDVTATKGNVTVTQRMELTKDRGVVRLTLQPN